MAPPCTCQCNTLLNTVQCTTLNYHSQNSAMSQVNTEQTILQHRDQQIEIYERPFLRTQCCNFEYRILKQIRQKNATKNTVLRYTVESVRSSNCSSNLLLYSSDTVECNHINVQCNQSSVLCNHKTPGRNFNALHIISADHWHCSNQVFLSGATNFTYFYLLLLQHGLYYCQFV